MELTTNDPVMSCWAELDRLNIQGALWRWLDRVPGASIWPWESDDPNVQDVWEQLTRPSNLAGLTDWARDMQGWSGLAVGCTVMAVETCRLRAGADGVLDVSICTSEALAVIRQRYPGHEFPPRMQTLVSASASGTAADRGETAD